MCRTLEQQVTTYRNQRLLGDDDGADPYRRLDSMHRLLTDL
jgi:hypothetical protein